MALEDILTLPLKVAQDLLTQPVRPTAAPEAYDDEVDKAKFEQNMPEFFRQAAQRIAQAQEVRTAQQEEFAARQSAQAQAPEEYEEEPGQQYVDPRVRQAEAVQRGAALQDAGLVGPNGKPIEIPMDATPGARSRGGYNPLHEPTITPLVEDSAVGGALGWVKKNVAKQLEPIGEGIEKGIEATGRGVAALPEWVPGDTKGIGEAFERIPAAAAVFKKTFAESYEEEHGVPLTVESAVAGIAGEMRNEIAYVSEWSDKILTDYTLDPLLHLALPEFMADPAVKATGFIASALPYVALAVIGGIPAATAMTAVFALLAVEDTKNLIGAYSRGQIDGKTLALGVGLNSIDMLDPISGRLIGRATQGFRSQRAVKNAIRDIEAITGKKADTSLLGRGINAAESLQERAPSYEQLADEKFGPGASLTREERMAGAAARIDGEAAPDVDAPAPLPVAEVASAAVQNATRPEGGRLQIDETPQTPLDEKLDRHRLTTPEGDRLDYRGTHINDVTAITEGEGRGTALLNRAIEDIRARQPGETITADLNSEAGARLFARQPGARFADARGNGVTPEEAIALAAAGKGSIVSLPAPRELVSAIGRQTDAPNVGGPVDASNEWTMDTFDNIERQRVQKNQYGEIWERRDGGFDFVDSRWADIRTGKAQGSKDAIVRYDTLDDARRALEVLTARFSKSPDARLRSFREDADKAVNNKFPPEKMEADDEALDAYKSMLANPDQQFTDENLRWLRDRPNTGPRQRAALNDELARRYPETANAAQEVASNAKSIPEEAADLARPRNRSIRDATEASNAAQTFDAAVKATKEEGGATISRTGELTPLKGRFLTGDDTPGVQTPFDEFSTQSVIDYIKKYQDRFLSDERLHIGTEIVWEDGNHNPLSEADGGIKFVNMDAVTPMDTKAEAEELAATLEGGHVHDFTDEGLGVLKDADGNAQAKPKTKKPKTQSVPQWQLRGKTAKPKEKPDPMDTSDLERGPLRSLGGRDYGLLGGDEGRKAFFDDGETGALNLDQMGIVLKEWVKTAGVAIKRVVAYVAKTGRLLHSSELGAIFANRRKFDDISADDLLDFGASRRWLHPDEDWAAWATEMKTRIGGTTEFWNSQQGRVRTHVEKQFGLMGEGPQGVTDSGVRFGREAGPATYTRLIELYNEGVRLKQDGKRINMAKWYDGFWRTMKDHFGSDAEMMTRMMAMTQANNAPSGGVPIAMRAYIQWKLGDPIQRMGSRTIRNEMESFLMGHVPAGDKINPFWEALRFIGARGRNAVAVDRWVIAAMGARSAGPGMDVKNLQGNSRFIRFSQNLITAAAEEAGVSPRAFQAAIWGGFRKEWDKLIEAAGGRPLGGDNDFFENLLVRKLKDKNLRSPSDFRLNTSERVQQSLFDMETANMEIEAFQVVRAKELRPFLNAPGANADTILGDIAYNEWNTKLAAAHLLDTGEVPTHLKTPEVIDEVQRVAAQARMAFTDRVAMAETKTLKELKMLPEWQKRLVKEEIEARKVSGENITPGWQALPKEEQRRLQTLGWMRIPENPVVIARTNALLRDLDKVKTADQLDTWMKRSGVQAIIGDKKHFVGRANKTGETYTDATGKVIDKTRASDYWEPRSFYENRLVLNVERVKSEIRRRFPVDANQTRNGGATLKLADDERLGECGIAAAAEML